MPDPDRIAESKSYWYFAVSGDPSGVVSADVAILTSPPPTKPTAPDWVAAEEIVDGVSHQLWEDALASGAQNQLLDPNAPFYFVAKLVGGTGGTTFVVTAGNTYTSWVRLNGTIEVPILIAPTSATIT